MSRRWKSALAVAAALFAAPTVAAPVPAPTAKVEGDTAVSKARLALGKPVTAKADGKTLTEAVEMFKELAKVDITLDTNAIQMMGMDPNQPVVKFEFKDAKLKDGLKAAFGPLNLRYGVTGTGIVISTDEGIITRQLRHRVSVEADGKTLATVLKELTDESGANVVVDPRAKKLVDEKITLTLDDVPVETAVRLAAEVAGASVVRMSNVLFVTTEARAEKLRPDADRPVQPGNPGFPGLDGPVGPGGFFPGGGGIGGPGVIPPPAAPGVQAVPGVIEQSVPAPVQPPKEAKKER